MVNISIQIVGKHFNIKVDDFVIICKKKSQ